MLNLEYVKKYNLIPKKERESHIEDCTDRGYVMETGSLILEGTGPDLLRNKDVQRAYIGKEYTSIDET